MQKLAVLESAEFEGRIAKAREDREAITASRVLAPLMSSNSAEWYTPPDIIARARRPRWHDRPRPLRRPCEVCAGDASLHRRHDGLSKPWHGHVYMNPPYGSTIGDWASHPRHCKSASATSGWCMTLFTEQLERGTAADDGQAAIAAMGMAV